MGVAAQALRCMTLRSRIYCPFLFVHYFLALAWAFSLNLTFMIVPSRGLAVT